MKKVSDLACLAGLLLAGLLAASCSREGGAAGDRADSVVGGFDKAAPRRSLRALKPSNSLVVFPQPEVDIGNVAQHTQHHLEFPFRIEGEDPVIITKVEPGCGCTEPSLEVGGKEWPLGTPLPAGTEGIISATFNSESFRGLKQVTITVRGNGRNLPDRVLLKSRVFPTYRVAPTPVTFPTVLRGEERSAEVVVQGFDPFEVKSWTRKPPGLEIEETVAAAEGGRAHRFRVTLKSDASIGRIYGNFLAETSLPIPLEILVVGRVVGPVIFTPDQGIRFGILSRGQGATRSLSIKAYHGSKDIPDPEIAMEGDPVFKARVTRNKAGKDYTIRIQIDAQAGEGSHQGTLSVRFPEDPGLGERRFPVSVVIRKS
ncbi:MAG: DUF1573 domain-containing protein [Planctomycetota bacterium]